MRPRDRLGIRLAIKSDQMTSYTNRQGFLREVTPTVTNDTRLADGHGSAVTVSAIGSPRLAPYTAATVITCRQVVRDRNQYLSRNSGNVQSRRSSRNIELDESGQRRRGAAMDITLQLLWGILRDAAPGCGIADSCEQELVSQ